jgi:hypothetical protein
MYAYMKYLRQRFELSFLQWNFFSTSHGKGAVDGVGGSAKRTVWQKVQARKAVVSNAAAFARVLRASGSEIEARHIEDLDLPYENLRFIVAESHSVSFVI